MSLTSLHGLRAGFDVFGVMDPAGSETLYAHNMAVERMIQAGVVTLHMDANRFRMDE